MSHGIYDHYSRYPQVVTVLISPRGFYRIGYRINFLFNYLYRYLVPTLSKIGLVNGTVVSSIEEVKMFNTQHHNPVLTLNTEDIKSLVIAPCL